jgi:hypothetical protein
MSSPERLVLPNPTIDPSLLELDGRVYKDRSRAAAVKRAAYHRARAAQSLVSSSSASPAGQTLTAASGIGNHFADFANFGTSADWTPQYGTQEAGEEGWIMHSQGDTSSRMVFNYPVNDGSSPHTVVRAWMRGAPDNGKNSYVTLIEQPCADNPQGNFCDEIDIVEYYGQTSDPRSEFTVHQNGQEPNAGSMVWPTPADPGPGHIQTSYDIYLEPGSYLSWDLYAPDGATLGTWDIHSADGFGYVPSRTMNLYVGIWDIGSIGINVDNPPGSFTGDSWMALSAIQVWTDF